MSAAAKDLIMKLKTVVENGNSASEEVHDALQALMQQPISVELLQETKPRPAPPIRTPTPRRA